MYYNSENDYLGFVFKCSVYVMEKNMSKVFLSYAREDSFYATSLYDKLSVAGYQPFMDTKILFLEKIGHVV